MGVRRMVRLSRAFRERGAVCSHCPRIWRAVVGPRLHTLRFRWLRWRQEQPGNKRDSDQTEETQREMAGRSETGDGQRVPHGMSFGSVNVQIWRKIAGC